MKRAGAATGSSHPCLLFLALPQLGFRLQPEFHVPANWSPVVLPKLSGARPDFFPGSPCCEALLQPLPQFLNEGPEPLRCRSVSDARSQPLCAFKLPFQPVMIFIHGNLIACAICPSATPTAPLSSAN
jgi:hypothetical protein